MACKSTSSSPSNTAVGCANCTCTPSSSRDGPSASLPARAQKGESTPLLWHTTSANYDATSAQEEDACPSSHGATCCRVVNSKEERTLIDPDLARDCIVGLSDGLTVPFALTAGLSSVGSSRLVVLAGFAELVSGAISMGIGGFLSAQAEIQHFNYNLKNTRDKVERSCDSEIDRQVEQILKDYGIEKDTCRKVARELRRKEEQRQAEAQRAPAPAASSRRRLFGIVSVPSQDVESVAKDEDEDEAQVGLTPFLLRVGSGLEPVSTSRLYVSALTIGLSYFFGGAIPLLPYVFIDSASRALLVSIIVTGIILLIFGVVKQRVTGGEGGFKGYAWGAISTLAVGGVAAGASWLLVSLLENGGE